MNSLCISASGGSPAGPPPPAQGPGSADYLHEKVRFRDFADKPDGYWLFEPAQPTPDTAAIVVFNHGYGAINPMIYGAWIRHLVLQGHIVIYPRYQRNLIFPSPGKFVDNASQAIRDALAKLKEEGRIHPDEAAFFLAGHSYGGTIAANIACRYEELGIPKPRGVLLCAPGTGPFKGGLLESYETMPAEAQLLIVLSINDYVVGEELGRKIYKEATHTPQRNLIRILPDEHGEPALTSEHNESYALDETFDTGLDNVSTQRARRIGKTNVADYYGFWKLMDAMMDCSLSGEHCNYAFGNTEEQRYMGMWSDSTEVRRLEVWVPEG